MTEPDQLVIVTDAQAAAARAITRRDAANGKTTRTSITRLAAATHTDAPDTASDTRPGEHADNAVVA